MTAVADPDAPPPSIPARVDKGAPDPGHASPKSDVGVPKPAPPLIDRRIAVAGAVLGFGLGLALGLKLASGMPKAVEVPVPTRVPCRDCAERARLREENATRNGSNPPAPDHAIPFDTVKIDQPVTFSPLEAAPDEMVSMAHVPTDAGLPPDLPE